MLHLPEHPRGKGLYQQFRCWAELAACAVGLQGCCGGIEPVWESASCTSLCTARCEREQYHRKNLSCSGLSRRRILPRRHAKGIGAHSERGIRTEPGWRAAVHCAGPLCLPGHQVPGVQPGRTSVRLCRPGHCQWPHAAEVKPPHSSPCQLACSPCDGSAPILAAQDEPRHDFWPSQACLLQFLAMHAALGCPIKGSFDY